MLKSLIPTSKHSSVCMNKLDRLTWVAGTSFTSYGTRVGVRSNDASVIESIANYLPPRWRPSVQAEVDTLFSIIVGDHDPNARPRRLHLLYQDTTRLARTTDMEEVLEAFESALHISVALGHRERLFLHAGVVAWEGQAILIPGRSMSGKSSLVKALVDAGATYYSDEYAILDAQGRVHPYPKALSLRRGDGQRPLRCPIESLGKRAGTTPLPVTTILFTQYAEGATWQPHKISPAQAMLALLPGHWPKSHPAVNWLGLRWPFRSSPRPPPQHRRSFSMRSTAALAAQ